MTDSAAPRRWINTEIPLWGVFTFLIPFALYFVNLEFRIRALEADSIAYKKTYESVGKMVWQIDTMAKDSGELKETVKSIATQNMDIFVLQQKLAEVDCRTGGSCAVSPSSARRPR